MFKCMPLKLKRWKTGNVFIFAFISLLFLMQNNAFAADMTFNLVHGLNGISLPFEGTGITDAEGLCQSIPYCESVSYWDAQTQEFITHQRGSTENNFSVTSGYPYFVSVTQDTSWMVSGYIPESVTFILITTQGTDINTIALPINMSYIKTAEDLANAVPNCDTVWYWDTAEQGYVGHPLGTNINDFNVFIGNPYFVNVTAGSTWTVDVALKAKIDASKTKGGVPLDVKFSAIVKGGTPPYTYAWDIDGNGTIIDDTRQSFNHIYQQIGVFNVNLTVTDAAGNTAYDFNSVTITALYAPTVVASANPTSGGTPLNVAFSATASDPDGFIALYEWDFDGDGTYDYSNTTSPNTSHTYTSKGTYKATIRVTDNDGLTAQSAATIIVGIPPVASASADKLTGTTPLTVNFTGTGTDTDGSVVLYEWDFNGDGIYDTSSTTTGNATYIYSSSGIYNATLRITDNDGLIDTTSVTISVAGPPIALPRGYPTSGNAPLKVTFFTDGKDLDGSPEYYDWDFDGNGVYDRRLIASMNTTYTYATTGTYNAALKVTDNEGLTSTASVTITVIDPNPQGYPTATASANPTNGGAPLTVSLRGSGTDPNGNITKYEWDFEGDGVYDWQEPARPTGPIGLLIDPGSYSSPAFVDVDNDGDFDLFVGNYDGTLYYYRNDGTNIAPFWTSMGLVKDSSNATIDVSYYSSPAFVDIDNDGDLDMFIGEYNGRIYYYRNDGTNTAPSWTSMGLIKNSSNATIDVGSYSSPAFVDIDNDGDYDMFIGEYYGNIYYYRNDGTNTAPSWTPMGQIKDASNTTIDVGSYSIPAFMDIDNDGDFDLFVGESNGNIYYYRNDGTNTAPSWTSMGQVKDSSNAVIDVGSISSPAFANIDNDGDYDLFIGESNGMIYYYRNYGSNTTPVWSLMSSKYNYIGVDNYSAPAFSDIDNDGDYDLFSGEINGRIYFYRNDGTNTSPNWTSAGMLTDSGGTIIDVGSYSSPAFVDVDNDGDFDLFVGNYDGTLYYYRNDGTNIAPFWTSMGLVKDSSNATIDVSYYSNPVFVDIDNDGDLDMFIGEYNGRIYYYRNDGTNTAPSWTSMGLIKNSSNATIDVGSYSSPAFVDIDNDGDFDLFVGEYYGTIYYYRNDGSFTLPIWTLVTSNYNSIDQSYYSKPAFADIDADGDYDLFVGEQNGMIYFYPLLGYIVHTYSSTGTYNATLRVTDNSGLTDTDSVTISVYDTGAPTAEASAKPTSGNAPLAVSFTGRGTDPNGIITKYEWDFDGDGVYDWSSTTSGNVSYTYTKVGTFNATLRVTDNDGKTATDSVLITTPLAISTTRTGIFNPIAGQTGTISSTLSGDSLITIKVIDSAGNVVRTLVSNASRAAGTYSDIWDGKNDSGKLVNDGVYYFFIEHTENGVTQVYDLRQTATYTEITPSRSWPSTFNPYEDNFMSSTYYISKPAEVSMYLWKRDYTRPESSIAPVRTLFIREPKGAGSHTEIWDGVDDKGAVVGSWSGGYPITLWVYELSDNAIIITGNRPVINTTSAEPNYFSPAYNPYGSTTTQYTMVSFNLSEAANIEVKITNPYGFVVKTISKTNLPAGANTLIWDGKDFNGNIVKEGTYSIGITAIDSDGNRSLPRYAAVYVYY